MIPRPAAGDCNEYYFTYINQVPDGDIIRTLENEIENTVTILGGISEEQAMHRYAPEKWSVKEIIGHVIDAERVFAFRAFWIARNDKSELAGMDQDDFVKFANFDSQEWGVLQQTLREVRQATVALFKSLDEEMIARKGIASGFEFTVHSFPWIIAGHEIHHLKVIQERYL